VSFVQLYLEYTLILKTAFLRIVVFYVGGVFVIGLIVPRDADVFIGGSAEHKIAASPFVHGKGTQS
jgi:yeast amino acid transporter